MAPAATIAAQIVMVLLFCLRMYLSWKLDCMRAPSAAGVATSLHARCERESGICATTPDRE
jgi:hypothetical protein